MPKVDKNPAKVFIVLFYAVIQFFDVALIQKAQDFFLELAGSFARDNLHQINFFVYRFLHDAIQFSVNISAAIVDIMKVELEFGHSSNP
jgi:hypothetical protein